MARRSVLLVIATLLVASCSSKANDTTTAAPSPSASSASPSASAQSTAGPHASGTATPGATATATGSAAKGATPAATSHSSTVASSSASATSQPSYTRDTITVVIKPCVQPGQTQTLSFHLRPNMQVVVDTRYADGKDGQVHGGFDHGRRTDAQGNYKLTWLVDPAAPIGPADSLVGAVDGSGTANGRGDFRVAARC